MKAATALVCLLVVLSCDRETAPVGGGNETKSAKPATADAKPAAPDRVSPTRAIVPEGPITPETLVAFLPERMAGAKAMSRDAIDEALAAAAYRTSAPNS